MSVYVVAEMSANHNQDYGLAVEIVHAAKEAGADAVKLQTYTPDTMTINCALPEFRIGGGTPWDGEILYNLYKRACMPWKWQPKLKEIADKSGIDMFSTAYDKTAVDFLEEMGVAMHKVASFELVDLPLIKYIASKGKPMIMSTGMATLEEIKEATQVAIDAGATDVTLLRCVSAYPSVAEDMNINSIQQLWVQFVLTRDRDVRIEVGLSDHTLGVVVPAVAVALGACMVEKHFTLSRDVETPDSNFSLEPREFKAMVEGIRTAEKALGEGRIEPARTEEKSKLFRRSLFVVEDMRKGEVFSEYNIRAIRPGYGLSPKHIDMVMGKKAKCDIRRGTPLQWELISC